jgi:hypothetical protein
MPLSNQELINKSRSAVALLLEESFGSKYSINLPALCTSVEASLKEILKSFISATLECGAPLLDSDAGFESSEDIFYLDNVYRIRILEDMIDPLLINVLIWPSGIAKPVLRQPIKKKIMGNGRFSRLAVHTNDQLERMAPLFAILAKTTFETGYAWLENRVHDLLATLHRSENSSQSLAENMGRFIRTLAGESLANHIWFMVTSQNSSMLGMDARKRLYSLNTLAKERRRHGHSPLEQVVALATTVLPFNQTLTYKAMQGDGSLRSKFLDAPYARPATPFMHALRTAFESEVASVNVLTPDSEIIVALGCPDFLRNEVKKHLTKIREGIQRIIRNRTSDLKESLRIANFHSSTAALRFETAEVAGAFKKALDSDFPTEPRLVFISYSHSDEIHKDNIVKHLTPLVRAQQINIFTDRGIRPGSEWELEIAKYILRSNIVLALLSADFIASDYCYEKELSNALQRHERCEAVVIPVFLRPCYFNHLAISRIQGVPRNAIPIEKLPFPEEGYVQVVEAVQNALSAR